MARFYPGLFELIFESLRNFPNSSRKQILREIFLFYYEIVCCVYSLQSPHRGDSNEYTEYTIILLKVENIFINYRHLPPDLAPRLNLNGSNYTSLEQISMVPKMFEPLKFDCNCLSHSRFNIEAQDVTYWSQPINTNPTEKTKIILTVVFTLEHWQT